jgi:hypothetical protein
VPEHKDGDGKEDMVIQLTRQLVRDAAASVSQELTPVNWTTYDPQTMCCLVLSCPVKGKEMEEAHFWMFVLPLASPKKKKKTKKAKSKSVDEEEKEPGAHEEEGKETIVSYLPSIKQLMSTTYDMMCGALNTSQPTISPDQRVAVNIEPKALTTTEHAKLRDAFARATSREALVELLRPLLLSLASILGKEAKTQKSGNKRGLFTVRFPSITRVLDILAAHGTREEGHDSIKFSEASGGGGGGPHAIMFVESNHPALKKLGLSSNALAMLAEYDVTTSSVWRIGFHLAPEDTTDWVTTVLVFNTERPKGEADLYETHNNTHTAAATAAVPVASHAQKKRLHKKQALAAARQHQSNQQHVRDAIAANFESQEPGEV